MSARAKRKAHELAAASLSRLAHKSRKNSQKDVFNVERIVGERVRGGRMEVSVVERLRPLRADSSVLDFLQYFIKWEGYSSNENTYDIL